MDYLLEIFTEEIPAMLLNKAVRDIKTITERKIHDFNIKFKKIETLGTPRRLVLFIWGLDEKEQDIEKEIKGPPVSIAFDKDGNPTQVFDKFLLSNNLTKEDVVKKNTPKGSYLFAIKHIKGKTAEEVVKEISLFLLQHLNFPNPMYWDNPGIKFIRPIRGIISLLGNKVIKFTYAGVESGRTTYGLRIDKPRMIEVDSPNDYLKKLREQYVILSFDERKKMVERNMKIEASKVNGHSSSSLSHLEEVVNLTEYPTPFLAKIDKEALNIPDCITESIIEGHLKSIVVRDNRGKLLPYFIGVRNGLSDFVEVVKAGYEKVVKARVLDGKFFFEEDKRNKLDDLVEKLKGVIFIKDLGTLYDKTLRLVKLSETTSKALSLSDNEAKKLKRAAYLSKADLVSNVVKEFPNLQGKMGSIYAEIQGEEKDVSAAIYEQYLPLPAGNLLPKTKIGALLSIMDKIDTLVGAFGIGVKVSGSKDPFGLRRVGNGLVQILFSMGTAEFPLSLLINSSIETYKKQGFEINLSVNELELFLKERAKSLLKELSFRYDVINAVISLPVDFMPTYPERAKVLEKHLDEDTLLYIVLSNKRVKNILGKYQGQKSSVDPSLFFERDEEALYNAVVTAQNRVSEELKQMNYEEVMNLFYALYPVISQFFDNVLVMDKKDEVRKNRFALLSELKSLFDAFADFSEIALEKKGA